jgi:hypothetical protein
MLPGRGKQGMGAQPLSNVIPATMNAPFLTKSGVSTPTAGEMYNAWHPLRSTNQEVSSLVTFPAWLRHGTTIATWSRDLTLKLRVVLDSHFTD